MVVGSGWAGFYIAENIDLVKYDATVISPRRTSAYTPLLASAACGVFNFYLAEDSVRSKSRQKLHFIKAVVSDIDFENKSCKCSPAPAFDDEESLADFNVSYDILVLAPGCVPNTFGTPGVEEHALFLKNVSDAMKVRKILFDLLEKASLPNMPDKRIKEMLHIAVVGGGPTGIEMTAELDDLAHHELRGLYPDVADKISISIHDVAPNILGAYDKKLYEYANTQLVRRSISVETNSHIEKVEKGCFYTKEKGRIGCGILIWATGNKNVPLIEKMDVRLPSKGLQRVITDSCLRVFRGGEHTDTLHDGVFALGDAADIDGVSLPTTAEVAVQKAKYLVNMLNKGHQETNTYTPFVYEDKQLVSYIGGRDGIIAGKDGEDGWTGRSAWLAWRGSNITWTRNWRSRLVIAITWVLNSAFGKEVAKL